MNRWVHFLGTLPGHFMYSLAVAVSYRHEQVGTLPGYTSWTFHVQLGSCCELQA